MGILCLVNDCLNIVSINTARLLSVKPATTGQSKGVAINHLPARSCKITTTRTKETQRRILHVRLMYVWLFFGFSGLLLLCKKYAKHTALRMGSGSTMTDNINIKSKLFANIECINQSRQNLKCNQISSSQI